MILSDIYISIIAYIKWAVNDPSVTVFQAYQSSTRAKKPFIIVGIGGFKTEGTPVEYEINNLGVQKLVLNKKFTLTLNSFSDSLHQAEELLNLVKDRLHTHSARSLFFKGDIVPRTVLMGVKPIPQAESGINESRAILEVEFAFNTEIEDNVGVIETIVVDNKINNETIIVSK